MKRSASLWAPILAAVILTQPSISNAVPNTFMAGDPIDADEMNANFADLEQRMAAIEDGDNQIVPVDCTGDPDAFLDPNPVPITDNTTFVLTGMCNGPIWISRKRNVIIEGDSAGVAKDDGVILPGGLTDNPFAAVGIWESNAELRNLTIDASAYATDDYPFNDTIAAVSVGQHAIARIYDVDIDGGDYGLSAFRQSYVKTYSNVRVRNFNLYGIEAWGNAHVEIRNVIEVTGAATTSATYPYAINSGSGGFVQINDGGTFTPAGSGSQPDSYSLGSYDNGVIQIKDSGTTTLNGDVESMRGSSIRILGGTTITGYVGAYDAGKIRLQGGTVQSGGPIDAYRNSTVRIRGGSSITGDVNASLTSSIRIQESSTVNGGIYASQSSSIILEDSVQTGPSVGAGFASSLRIEDSTFAGDISVSESSSIRLSNSTHTGTSVVDVIDNSSAEFNNTPIDASNISVNDSSTLRLQNGSNHSGGDINANWESSINISNGDFSGNVNANDNSHVRINSGTQIGAGNVGSGGNGTVVITGTSVASVSANSGTVYFYGESTATLGSASGFNNSSLFLHDATVNGQIDTSAGGYLHMNNVTQSSGSIELSTNASADIFNNSSVGLINAFGGAVVGVNFSSVNGILLGHGSIGSIYGVSVTGDIMVDGQSSNLHITDGGDPEGTGPGTMNGNTIYQCGNTTSYIGIFNPAAVTSPACGP